MTVNNVTNTAFHVKISDSEEKRHQVYLPTENSEKREENLSPKYNFKRTRNAPISWQVTRPENGEVLFDTNGYPMIFEDQYLQITAKLPTKYSAFKYSGPTAEIWTF